MTTKKQSTRTPIATNLKPFTLKTSYAHNGYMEGLNAYTEGGHAKKQQFLKDSVHLMKAIGSQLATQHGFTEMCIHKNQGGIAVSGEVYAEYWHPSEKRWLYCWLESTAFGWAGRRSDSLILTARWRESRGNGHADSYDESGNHDIRDLSRDSAALADDLLKAVFPGRIFSPVH